VGEAGAEVWSGDGRREQVGDFGDAVEHVLATATGQVWVGYFDEAMSGDGPGTHGLVRFGADLRPAWTYPGLPAPAARSVPPVFDCYALNVTGEMAWVCAYPEFHVVSVRGDLATDHGRAPHRSAHALVVDGRAGALIGGSGPEYDLVTAFRPSPDSPQDPQPPESPGTRSRADADAGGPQRRLVLPDGLEVAGCLLICRGADLHVIHRGNWYEPTSTSSASQPSSQT
jgi:hypothetical protein